MYALNTSTKILLSTEQLIQWTKHSSIAISLKNTETWCTQAEGDSQTTLNQLMERFLISQDFASRGRV